MTPKTHIWPSGRTRELPGSLPGSSRWRKRPGRIKIVRQDGAAPGCVPRAVVEQMMQQEAMRVRLHGQPAAEPPYADFFAWAGQQPAAARGGGGG